MPLFESPYNYFILPLAYIYISLGKLRLEKGS